jgi:hypothetical protein
VAPPFHLDPPTEGLNSDYVNAQTEALQSRMKELMAAFIKIDEEQQA